MMTEDQKKPESRSVEIQLEMQVPPEAVWRALTDAEELTRWYPLQAEVTPGAGGSILNIMGSKSRQKTPIVIWEPNKHLRVLWCKAETPEAEQFGVDFWIQDLGGGATRLRLVHFGFQSGEKWDKMYDSISCGWDGLTWMLSEYLHKHRGTPRSQLSLTGAITMPRDELWQRVFSPDGLLHDSVLHAKAGDRFTWAVGSERLIGSVRLSHPAAHDFQATIEPLDGALLFLGLGDRVAFLELNTFGVDSERLHALERALVPQLERILKASIEIEVLGKQ